MGSFVSRIVHYYYYYSAKSYLKQLAHKSNSEDGVELIKNNENGFAEIILKNIKKRNAISAKMMLELNDAISSLEKWKEGKCVLIRGDGNNFCSGGDLNVVKTLIANKKTAYFSPVMTDSLLRLSKLHMISAVYINGTGALGGGAEIASSVDFRFIHPTANIGFIHKKMGISPAWGGAYFLKRIIGEKQALKILYQGKVYNAEEALKIGLVDFIEDSEEAREKLLNIVDNMYHRVVRNIKKSVVSTSIEEQGKLCAELVGGEQNLNALNSLIKHVKKTE